jgi:beta-lactamase class A
MTLTLFRTIAISSFLFCSFFTANAQLTDKKLDKILSKSKELKPVLSQKNKYEVQVIYTQTDRNAQNRPNFTTYNFNVDPKRYFYPASTIKLPAVLLSLEKLNKLKINGLTKETPMSIGKAFEGHEPASADATSEDGNVSVAHYAKKILLVSDNDAFNRLYKFMGQEPFNKTLKSKGYRNLRIVHRLSIPYSREENSMTPEVWFGNQKAVPKVPSYTEPDRMEVAETSRVYTQEAQKNTSWVYAPDVSIRKGKGY